MKRVICFLQVLILMMQLGTVSYAAQTNQENYVDRLTGLGMFLPNESGALSSLVTNEEFAKYLLIFLKQNDVHKTETSYFYDVSSDNAYLPYINRAVDFGYIKVELDKKYYPKSNITAKEAGYAILRAMGYGRLLDSSSDSMASSVYLRIAKGVDTSKDGITVSELLLMFDNALEEYMIGIENFEGSNAKYNADTTFLEGYFKIKKAEGRINATPITSLNDDLSCSEGEAAIDGTVYKTADNITDISEYLGYWADIYYKEEDGENVIIYYEPKKTDEVVIKAEDYISYSNNRITYLTDGNRRSKTVSFKQGSYVIYNGILLKTYTPDIFDISNGSIELVGKSGSYDVVKIYDYVDVVVGSVSDHVIYSKYSDNSYDIEEFDKVIIRDWLGRNMLLSEIKENDVASVGISKDLSMLIINIYHKTVTGTFKAVKTDMGKEIWTVDDKEYSVSPCADVPQPEINAKVTMYFNYLNYIAYAEISEGTNGTYAYLARAYLDDSDERAIIRIYTEFGEWKDYTLSEKTKIDGDTVTGRGALTALSFKNPGDVKPQDMVYPQLIRYYLNAKGEVRKIDTSRKGLNESADTTLSKDITDEERRYFTETSRLYGLYSNEKMDCLIGDSTKVFVVPSNFDEARSEYDSYSVAAKSYFVREGIYTIDAYDVDYKKGALAGAVCVKLKSKIEKLSHCAWNNMLVVTGKNKVWSEKEEAVVTSVTGFSYSSNSMVTLEGINEVDVFADVEPGDWIRYGYVNNRLTTVIKDLDISNHRYSSIHPPEGGANWNGDHVFALYAILPARLVDIFDGFMYMDYTPSTESTADGCKFIFDTTKMKAFVYNKAKNKIYPIDKGELRDYKYSVNQDAELVVYSSYGVANMVVVYI